MAKFVPVNNIVIPQAIDETSTTQLLPLGTRVRAYDVASTAYGEGEFIYLKGVASTVLGSVVIYSQDDNSTALLVANAIGPVAVSMSDNVASSYGWYQIFGKAVGKPLTGFADNANCYATATAGSIDDTVVAGDRVKCMKGASAIDTPATGLAELEIQYPYMDDGLAA
tara:strand:- start:136 stop:639 length:504 start_codon:yes stop_codon:yes gene_type:complete